MSETAKAALLKKLEAATLYAGSQGEQTVKVSLTFEQSESLRDALAFAMATGEGAGK